MRVIQTSIDEDMSEFCRYLWQHRVVHRVFEESGSQVLEVADAAQAGPVREAYAAWRDGRLRLPAEAGQRADAGHPAASGGAGATPATVPRWRRALARYPVLSALVLGAVALFPFSYPLAEGRLTDLTALLLILDPRLPLAQLPALPDLLARLEIWRWFTPMFLHFSVVHLAFNCAVTAELGRRVEGALGSGGMVVVVLALAGSSNLIQYAVGGGPMFGGLSGVAYGFLGFVLAMNRLRPTEPSWLLPKGLSISLLIFLVVFTTGITEAFGLHVANAAHWGGFGAGILLALGYASSSRRHGR
jgi:GlpG protein